MVEQNDVVKKKMHEEMLAEQNGFVRFLAELDIQTNELKSFTNLKDVDEVALRVVELQDRLDQAQSKARLF